MRRVGSGRGSVPEFVPRGTGVDSPVAGPTVQGPFQLGCALGVA